MNKIILATLFLAALGVAIWALVTKKRLEAGNVKGWKRHIVLMATLLLALIPGCDSKVSDQENVQQHTQGNEKVNSHWNALIEQWKDLRKQIPDKVILGQGAKWQEKQKMKKEYLALHKKEIDGLVVAKKITPRVGEVLRDAYMRMLEKAFPSERPTCYEVTVVGGRVMSIDFDREKAISELIKLKASGKVNKATVDKVMLRLARNYSLMKAMGDVHKSVKDWKKKEAKQMEMLDIFEGKEKGKIFKPTEDDMKAVKILYDLWDGKIPETTGKKAKETTSN